MKLRFALRNWRHLIKLCIHRGGGGRIRIGTGTYGAPRIRWWGENANLSIGKYCSIAEGVEIFLGGNHRTDWVTTYPFSLSRAWPEARGMLGHPATRGDVRIGNDVWLGAGCVVLSGVTIGHGAVVGCRAVVSRDIPDYAIVAGNPATVVRMRFRPEVVSQLLASAWWDEPKAVLRTHVRSMLSPDVECFLRMYERDTA